MLCFRSILLLALSISLRIGQAQITYDVDELNPAELAEFEHLLSTLPPESLKAALQSSLWPKYQEGVFVDGQDAMEAVRNHDPELATKLVDLAKQDAVVKEYLRKRQTVSAGPSNNSTSSSTSSSLDKSTVTFSTSTSFRSLTETSPVSSSTTSTTVVSSPSPQTSPSVSVPPDTTTAPPPPPPPPASSSPPASPSDNTETGVIVPVGVSTTGADGSPSVVTTDVFATSAPTSVVVQVSTTNAQGDPTVISTGAPAIVFTQTDSQGAVHTTTALLASVVVAPGGSIITSAPPPGQSAKPDVVLTTDKYGNTVVLSNPHAGEIFTTTDDKGRKVTLTYQPGGGVVSELELITTTLPDGQRSTITSFVIVGGTVADSTPTNTGGAKPTGKPGLQSGAALPSSYYAAEVAVLIGAAIGVAAFLY